MKRVPIQIVECEMPAGLPTERVYSCSLVGDTVGDAVGTVVLPPGLIASLSFGRVRLLHDYGPGRYAILCRSLAIGEAIRAAVAGELGLSWEPAPEWAARREHEKQLAQTLT